MDSLNFVSSCDTLFFLETYEYETGISYGKVWNNHKSITYQYFKNKFSFTTPSIFDRKTEELVGSWNVEKIKMYGTEKSNITNPSLIFASRAIIKQRKISVDCIVFNEFYLN